MVVYFLSLGLLLGEDMGKITPGKSASDYEYFPFRITTYPRVWAGKARSRVPESWLGGLRRITHAHPCLRNVPVDRTRWQTVPTTHCFNGRISQSKNCRCANLV